MKLLVALFLSIICFSASAQTDSLLPIADTLIRDTAIIDTVRRDTVVQSINKITSWKDDTTFSNSFKGPLISTGKPTMQIAAERPFQSNDDLFYLLIGVFAFFGIIRYFFPRYIQNIFNLLFQSSFRQKQTRDQLIQDTLPSILTNLLFFIVTGLFITIALERLKMSPFDFWQTFLYTSGGLLIIYVFKYFFLLFFGWVFNVRESTSVYAFIVFLINKILGVLLLPLLLLIAFSGLGVVNVVITIACSIFILLLVYRYIAALSAVRGDLRINALHFFIYLCAVEVAPLPVIFKLLADQIWTSI